MRFGQATPAKVKATAFLVFGFLVFALSGERDAVKAGTPMPEVAGKTFGGADVSLADFRGKVVLVHFFATWCGPCMTEFPKVEKLSNELGPKGLEILSVSLDSDAAKLAKFLERKEPAWDVLYSGDGWSDANSERLNVRGIPWMAVVDAEGNVAAQTHSAHAAEKKIRELLGE